MKIYEIKDGQGRLFAFEVTSFVGRHRVRRLVQKIPRANLIQAQWRFQIFGEEEFLEFELEGQRFVVHEWWNDSNRYWVGPKPLQWCPQIERVRAAFADFKTFWLF